MTATGPDSGVSTPSLIVLPSKPGPVFGAPLADSPPDSPSSAPPPQPATASARTAITAAITHTNLLLIVPPRDGLIRERPCLEVGLRTQPHGGQPTRLEHQEQHDQ